MWIVTLACVVLLRQSVEGVESASRYSGGQPSGSGQPVPLGTAGRPSTSFRCKNQEYPGIYADTEAGCQVFHFCESSGMNSTFFCPEQTLFNQQYFVCDWAYNVACDRSSDYYILNRDIYITPDKIYTKTSTADILASSSLISQLDSVPASAQTEAKTLGDTQSSGYRQGSLGNTTPTLGAPGIILPSGLASVPEGGKESGNPTPSPVALSINQSNPDEVQPVVVGPSSASNTPSSVNPSGLYSQPPPALGGFASGAYRGQPQVAYGGPVPEGVAAGYDDSADPEPTFFDPTSDPEPTSFFFGNQNSAGGSNSYASYDPYGADPEPAAAYYDAADPEPAAYYADPAGFLSSRFGGDAADPEPYPVYQQQIDLVGAQGATFNPALYSRFSSRGFAADFADPEPYD